MNNDTHITYIGGPFDGKSVPYQPRQYWTVVPMFGGPVHWYELRAYGRMTADGQKEMKHQLEYLGKNSSLSTPPQATP